MEVQVEVEVKSESRKFVSADEKVACGFRFPSNVSLRTRPHVAVVGSSPRSSHTLPFTSSVMFDSGPCSKNAQSVEQFIIGVLGLRHVIPS